MEPGEFPREPEGEGKDGGSDSCAYRSPGPASRWQEGCRGWV